MHILIGGPTRLGRPCALGMRVQWPWCCCRLQNPAATSSRLERMHVWAGCAGCSAPPPRPAPFPPSRCLSLSLPPSHSCSARLQHAAMALSRLVISAYFGPLCLGHHQHHRDRGGGGGCWGNEDFATGSGSPRGGTVCLSVCLYFSIVR